MEGFGSYSKDSKEGTYFPLLFVQILEGLKVWVWIWPKGLRLRIIPERGNGLGKGLVNPWENQNGNTLWGQHSPWQIGWEQVWASFKTTIGQGKEIIYLVPKPLETEFGP